MMMQEIRNKLKRSMRLRWFVVLLLWTSAFAVCALGRGHRFFSDEVWLICWNGSGSVPRGFYLRVPIGTLANGDYVVFAPNELSERFSSARGWSNPGTFWLKQVGALSGESFFIHPGTRQFFVNGHYIGIAPRMDSEGRPMPEILGEHIVPEGEFLPIGNNPRSFDGRYTGTVPCSRIRAKVVPILTGFW